MFAIAGALVSVVRFWQYETFYYDFGIFDQALWRVAHFAPPIIDHFVVGGKWIFADHFNPSIFLLSPLYWIFSAPETMLVAQASAVGIGGFLLYLTGVKVLKNRLLAFAAMISYLLFVGVQNAVITDFHEVTIASCTFIAAYYALVSQKPRWYFLFLLLTLGFKESNFIVGTGMGVSIFFLNRKWWKIALVTCLISLVWGALAIKVIIPFFSGGFYQYGSEQISFNPLHIVTSFIDVPVKVKTILYSFWSFGFVSLLSPAFYGLIFLDFLTRFSSPNWVLRWELGLHYSILLSAILGVSAVFGLRLLQRFLPRVVLTIIALAIIGNALFLYRFVMHGPFALAYNPSFYQHTHDFVFLDVLLSKIPANASVMTQNSLAGHFTHRNMWLLRIDYEPYKPDYIAIDARPGQRLDGLWGSVNIGHLPDSINELIGKIKADVNYQLVYHSGDHYLFKRVGK
ncbi:DUF2079 domain-containing protein [Candidatus Roizmanbacteria bacterium]|nr:DUF2079 domain-containing protein [Candidatus Roizmanbacteria bacterium]